MSAIPVKYGVYIAIGLIAYFLILSLFGVQTNPVFSLGNGVIVAFGLYRAMKIYKEEKRKEFDYQKGFMTGLLTGFNATLIFTAFFCSICNQYSNRLLARNACQLEFSLPRWCRYSGIYSRNNGIRYYLRFDAFLYAII